MRIYRNGIAIELTEVEVERAKNDFEFRSDVAMVNDKLEELIDDDCCDIDLEELSTGQRAELVERIASLWRYRIVKADYDYSEVNDFELDLLLEAASNVFETERDDLMNPVAQADAARAEPKYRYVTKQGWEILERRTTREKCDVLCFKRFKSGDVEYAIGTGYNEEDGTWSQGSYFFSGRGCNGFVAAAKKWAALS